MAEITVKKYPANINVFVDGIRTYIDIDGLSFDDEIDVERSIDIDLSRIESNIEMNLSDDDKEKISNELRFYYDMMIEKKYRVNHDYFDLWDANKDDIMSESEVRDLAAEWDMSFEDVLEQLEEV